MEDVTTIPLRYVNSYLNKYIKKRNKSLKEVKRLLTKINKCHQKMNNGNNPYWVTKDINETQKILIEELSNLRTINHDLKYLKQRQATTGIRNYKNLGLRDYIHELVLTYDEEKYPDRSHLHSFNKMYKVYENEYKENYPRLSCVNNACTHFSNNYEDACISKNNDNLPYNLGSLERYIHDDFTTSWYKLGFN